MESKKVKEFIDDHVAVGQLQFTTADIEFCVNMAEQEIREAAPAVECQAVNIDVLNYRVAAVEAFRGACPHRSGKLCDDTYRPLGDDGDGHMEECHAGCEYAKRFTHCLGDLIRKMNG